MMKTKFISIIATAAIALTGCSHLLDIPQHGAEGFEGYYSTDEEAENAITAAYLQLRSNSTNVFMGKNLQSDDVWAGGGGRNDNADLEQLNEFSFNPDQSYIQGMFEGYYKVIYKCNVILGHCTQDTPTMERVRAEARVIRALQYFDLITLWGNPPLVDHELNPSEYSRPNGTTEELWGLVNDDLKTAIESNSLFEKKSRDDKQWRVTKQFAQALYGKALLWQGKYPEAAAELDKVISSQLYDLYPDFEDIYLFSNKMNCESLFESIRITNPSNAFENFDFTHLFLHWRTERFEFTPEMQTRFVTQQTGYGFLSPRKALYDAFVAEEGKDGYRLNQSLKTVEQFAAMGMTLKGELIGEGTFQWKRRIEAAGVDPSSYSFSMEDDFIWMRFAEVLLLASEAHLQAGNAGKAAEYLNRVRQRAHLGQKGSVTLDDIKTEKRLELCYDMCRYQDLLRWGDAEKYLANQGGEFPTLQPNGQVRYTTLYNGDKTKYGWKKGRNELLPYPGLEMRLNNNIKQNPGW